MQPTPGLVNVMVVPPHLPDFMTWGDVGWMVYFGLIIWAVLVIIRKPIKEADDSDGSGNDTDEADRDRDSNGWGA